MPACDSDILRMRMHGLRNRMSGEVRSLKGNAHRLLDWRLYVARFPIGSVAAAALLGFWLAPGHTVTPTVKLDNRSMDEIARKGAIQVESLKKRKTLRSALLGMAGNMLWKTAVGYLAQQAGKQMAACTAPANHSDHADHEEIPR